MDKKIALLIIDPQIDFCEKYGSLYVNGAEEDIQRIADMILNKKDIISQIYVTLDSHYFYDISHTVMYRDDKGKIPMPFTVVSKEDIESGKIQPVFEYLPNSKSILFKDYLIKYIEELNKINKYPLCLWPPHCVIGTTGEAIPLILVNALWQWMLLSKKNVSYITKGTNILTEHYSPIKAEVPVDEDDSTKLNLNLVGELENYDEIWVCGEAGSHCLKGAIEDISDNFQNKTNINKIVLIEDCTSPVCGFENVQKEFVKNMTEKGMKTIKSEIL